jgi:glyoxylase-like metal-dependent hydrolase (beta-lactamase superfamily II)
MYTAQQPHLVPISLGMVRAFLILGERPILVDAGMRNHASRIVAAMAKEGVSPQDLALIVITHAHPDHIGGLAALRTQTSAPVVAHVGDAEAVIEGTRAARSPRLLGRLLGHGSTQRDARETGIEPDLLVEHELDLAPYGVQGRAISTPGHTPGSLSVLLDDGRAIVGDMFSGAAVRDTTFWRRTGSRWWRASAHCST